MLLSGQVFMKILYHSDILKMSFLLLFKAKNFMNNHSFSG